MASLCVGAVLENVSGTGRRWEITHGYYRRVRRHATFSSTKEQVWILTPLGDDVRKALGPDGKFQGGVRSIERSQVQLEGPRWRITQPVPF